MRSTALFAPLTMTAKQRKLDLKPPAKATPAQRPRPVLATPDGGTGFADCWARLADQWHLPADPLELVEGLSVYDLRLAALEIFSAGAVHHQAHLKRCDDLLGEPVQLAITRRIQRLVDNGRELPAPEIPPDASSSV